MPVDAYATTGVEILQDSLLPELRRNKERVSRFATHHGLATTLPEPLAPAEQLVKQLARDTKTTASELEEGARRLRRLVPGQMRLWRWRTTRFLRDSRMNPTKIFRRVLPIASTVALTLACSLVSQDGGTEEALRLSLAPAPELSKPKAAAPQGKHDGPWSYVLPIDHGVRGDQSGNGYFRAPRFHGEHNGIDLLAPVGTPLLSACQGKAMAGVSRSFGRWVHVICPVPEDYMKAGAPRPWASFFYAHLSEVQLPHNEWVDIERAAQVGAIGKSGNARGPNVQPHVHFEFIVQKNRRHAMDERHLGKDQSSVKAATYFVDQMKERCLEPHGFRSRSRQLQRARRIDPFLALTCLSSGKPDFVKAPAPLHVASKPWDKYYVARDFDVNHGPEG